MVDRVLDWASGSGTNEASSAWPPKTAIDVGCGIGGSTRHIARRFGCKGTGITLSPYQRKRAEDISGEAGLGDKVSFQVINTKKQRGRRHWVPFLAGLDGCACEGTELR